MKINKLLLLFLSLAPIASLAASSNSSIQVKTKINSGCLIQGNNYNFGPVNSVVNKKDYITLKCSKGTSVRIEAKTKNNPGGYRGFFLTLNGVMVPQIGNNSQPVDVGLKYGAYVGDFVNAPTHTITKMPQGNYLGINLGTGFDYGLELKTLNGEPVLIPVTMAFDNSNDFKRHIPGSYYDSVYFNLTY